MPQAQQERAWMQRLHRRPGHAPFIQVNVSQSPPRSPIRPYFVADNSWIFFTLTKDSRQETSAGSGSPNSLAIGN